MVLCEKVKTGLRLILIPSVFLLWSFWLLGQVVRDATWLSGLLFYIASPVVFVLTCLAALYAFKRSNRKIACTLMVFALVPAIFVLAVENRFHANHGRVDSADTLRLIHWNVFGARIGWNRILADLRQGDPDICILSELPTEVDVQSAASSLGNDCESLYFCNIAIIARGALRDGKWLKRQSDIKAYGVVWDSSQGTCRLLVVPLDSSLFLARDPGLLAIRELMVAWDADIVVGDFNAPRRSRALCPLPPAFVHAYDVVGSGWSYTWPAPCPVYAIDQCILGDRLDPVSYKIESSWLSDHRRQILEFSMTK